MNTVAPLKANTDWTAGQLKLIRQQVAKDANDAEFDMFIHTARAVGLDPLRRQIYCWIFNKSNPQYRTMTIVTAISGYRSIAERTQCYRPDDRAPRYFMGTPNPRLNPLGIERCEVTVYKYVQGDWHAVTGEAWWDEYVPVVTPNDGGEPFIDRKKTGWIKMPRIMIAKCAEANALRKAWPDDFANLYTEDEMDRTHSAQVLDLTATEIVNQAETDEQLARMGGKDALTVDWGNGSNPMQLVPDGQFCEKALAWLAEPGRTNDEAEHWWRRNEVARSQYKARHGGEYLEFQKAWEKQFARLEIAKQLDESANNDREMAVIERLKERLAQCTSLADVEKLEKDAASTIDKLSLPRHAEALKLIAKARGGD